ncbi:UV-endonuclease UvdE, partial [Wolfiporia cocos MD-104 SS10]
DAQPKKRQRRRKDTAPVVYDILPVERKQTNFTGHLGYACLNTILRARKPEPVFCSRTCRLDTIKKNGIEFAKELGRRNVQDLLEVIQWNEDNQIRFFRVSSEMFPFASHKVHGYDLDYCKGELKAAGDLARKYGHRLTTHPGQFTQLASPRDEVVDASVRELEYHCQMMRHMELDRDSVIIIHMGGVYGDKEGALARFRENYRTRLTDEMKARLVLENDEMCYSPDDLLPVCDELGIPMVLDYHHNWINPSVHPVAELLPRVAATWARKGIRQKQHLSEPRPGAETVMEKRAHADRCVALPPELTGGDVDLMIEAKDKEQAVFHLYRIYGLAPVVHENLRPEKP